MSGSWFVEWRPSSSEQWTFSESFESESEAYGYILEASAEDPSVLLRVVPADATGASVTTWMRDRNDDSAGDS